RNACDLGLPSNPSSAAGDSRRRSHGAHNRRATALEIVRREASPPGTLPGRPRRRDRRPDRTQRRGQNDDPEGPGRPAAARLWRRPCEGPRRARRPGQLESRNWLHARGADAPGIADPERVPRLRRPHPQPAQGTPCGPHTGAPHYTGPGPESRRDDRLPVEGDESEARLRGRDHPRAVDPDPRRAADRHRSGGAALAQGAPDGDRPLRWDGPRLDPPARHGGAALRPRRDREPRPERRDGSLESLRASVDTGEHASLEEIFLRLTQEATAPEAEAPRRRGLFRRG